MFESQELRKPVVSFKVLFYVRICCPQVDRKVLAGNLELKRAKLSTGAVKRKGNTPTNVFLIRHILK